MPRAPVELVRGAVPDVRELRHRSPAKAESPALPPLGPSASQLNDFRELLVARIQGGATPEQASAVRDLLARMQDHPQSRQILSALQAYHQMRGEAPSIQLMDGSDPMQLPPILGWSIPGPVWNLNILALNVAPPEQAARELAAVYINLTGMLRDADPYLGLPVNRPPQLPHELEETWRQWVKGDSTTYIFTSQLCSAPSTRQKAIDHLRSQLCDTSYYGGVSRATLEELLLWQTDDNDRPVGLKVELRGLGLKAIPPLPTDVRILDIADNPIEDWSGLPPGLQALDATKTGGAGVLDHLPAGLLELEITDNSLVSLAADLLPRGLKVLKANNNVLDELSGKLPDSLETIMLADNRLTRPPPMPGGLKVLDLSNNQIDSMADGLPDTIQELDLSQNRLRHIPAGSLPSRLKRLNLSENIDLASLPALSEDLKILHVESTGLGELPSNLPRGLIELHASDLGLTRLPDDLPTSLVALFVEDNVLSELPDSITQLARCNVYLQGNSIAMENIPHRLPGNFGPRFHIALESDYAPRYYSAGITQAVQYWLNEQDSPAMQRWHAIAKARAGASGDSAAMAHLGRFLDRLGGTTYCASEEFCAGIQEWLDVLSTPERASLLEDTLQACTGATERCDDRIGLMLDELRTLRLHDDIRIGLYGDRPADVVAALRQTFCVNRLREIAYRKIASMGTVDDVEVYLAYTVELREPLGLTDVVPAMMFLDFSGVTRSDLDAALEEVRAAERTDFYKSLVVDDTWRTFLKQKSGARFEQALNRLEESMGEPLQERIRAELALRGIPFIDVDAHREIGLAVSRDMQYEALEPLTRAYLESAGVPVPEGAPDASAT